MEKGGMGSRGKALLVMLQQNTSAWVRRGNISRQCCDRSEGALFAQPNGPTVHRTVGPIHAPVRLRSPGRFPGLGEWQGLRPKNSPSRLLATPPSWRPVMLKHNLRLLGFRHRRLDDPHKQQRSQASGDPAENENAGEERERKAAEREARPLRIGVQDQAAKDGAGGEA
jgi:hypothetical protein